MELFVRPYMRIYYDHKAPLCICNCVIHAHDILHIEVFIVELSVLMLPGVLDVEPEHVYWEAVVVESVTAFYDIMGCHVLIFRVMEAKTVDRWHVKVSCEL